MPRKSLLVSMAITTAGRAHDCRYNKNHRIEKGDRRLTIKVDSDDHNYCLDCAVLFMDDSYRRLGELKMEIEKIIASNGKDVS